MKKFSGSISIYFVFAIVLIISVILSVTEIARINCQKLYLQIATDSALDSMASLYHRKLYKYYNLYGVEYRTLDMLETEYLEYMYPYFISEERYINNWYIANIDQDNIKMTIKTLSDDYYLEKEIINYEKYKLAGKAIKFLGKEIFIKDEDDNKKLFEEADTLFKEVEKSNLYGEIYERYFDFTDDIKALENYARKIQDFVDKINLTLNRIKTMSTGGSKSNAEAALSKFEELDSRVSNLYGNLVAFRDKMKDFRQLVTENYQKYQHDKASDYYEFNDEIIEFVESEFEHFISFVDEDSDMNKAVEVGFENCTWLSRMAGEDYREIRKYVSELSYLEAELRYEKSMKGKDRDTEKIRALQEEIKDLLKEISDFLKDVKENYRDVRLDAIPIIVSSTNHSDKESILKKLIGFKNGLLINLILDSDVLSQISSEHINYLSFNIMSNSDAISLEKVLFGEYELDKFNYFNKDLNDEVTISGSKRYEVERLISGRTDDLASLKDVINQIFLIRIAMNVLHIYKSSEKRQAARKFTALLFSGFSPLMVEAMFLVMITAWGTAQAVIDMKKLMKNKRVKLMHDDDSWTVSVDSILSVAAGNITGINDEDDKGIALNYKDYLRILLFKTRQVDVNARMVSIIDRNIKDEQESFDFEKMVYSFYVENKFTCKHFFTNLVFVPAKSVELYDQYAVRTDGYRCFYDNGE